MTEEELRKECGLDNGELLNTNRGLLDIFDVKELSTGQFMVSYGFLATGDVLSESVESFIDRVKCL